MSEIVEQAKQHTTAARDRILKTFSFVPDDKLNWSPGGEAKSALRLAAHAGESNRRMSTFIRGDDLSGMTFEEARERQQQRELAISTREQAIQLIMDSTDEVLAALDGLTPERIASEVKTPVFTAPMAFWMNLPARHMDNHASQIDYLQSCWGDTEWHF